MIKKDVTYLEIVAQDENGIQEKEHTETIRFVYTITAIKLFEQRTGKNFFDSYTKALTAFAKYAGGLDLKNVEQMDTAQQLALLPMLSDRGINEFAMGLIPCMYAKVVNGRYVQNDETAIVAEESLWMPQLINVSFFGELLKEISANQSKTATKNKKSKKE